MPETLNKEERLHSRKLIKSLFESGDSFTEFPFRWIWKVSELDTQLPVQFAVSVPRKKFKRAVDRNLLKRRTREAYRKNKQLLYGPLEKKGKQIALMAVYIGDEALAYKNIEDKIMLSLQRLARESE